MARRWFVLRAQTGREDQVAASLERRVREEGLESVITRVLVPSEKVSEIKSGQKRVRERKVYPNYLMVEIETGEEVRIPDSAWFLIQETAGIGDFIGSDGRPTPMRDTEVQQLLGVVEQGDKEPTLRIGFKVGDGVKIKEGPFENFDGVVEEVNAAKGLVKVVVTIFGRATPVELEYWQVESI